MAIGMKGDRVDKSTAFPFGIGVALVLDESALLLELAKAWDDLQAIRGGSDVPGIGL